MLNGRTPSWCCRELLVVGKTSTYLVTSSEVFFLTVKKDAKEKGVFPYIGKQLSFSLTVILLEQMRIYSLQRVNTIYIYNFLPLNLSPYIGSHLWFIVYICKL